MSNKLRSVNTKFWDDSFIVELSPTEKLLFLYLITNPLTKLIGIYEISLKRISFDTGLNSTQIENAFKRFGIVKKAFFVDGWVVLPNWLKNQNLNSNMKIAVQKEFNELPNSLKDKLLLNDIDTVSNGYQSILNALVMIRKVEDELEVKIKIKAEESNLDFVLPEFSDCFNKWLKYKKDRKESYKSEDSIKAAFNKLLKLSENNPKIADEIVEQSMANNYAGLFELKKQQKNTNNANIERDYADAEFWAKRGH